jgi:hypothetical protein
LERAEIVNEYEDIILASNKEILPKIDVLDQVMGRIAGFEDSRRPILRRIMKRTTALGGMLTVLLLISVTAYAASEYIQIRNGEGAVKVQHVAPNEVKGTGTSYNKYAMKAQSFAKPGELIAYYVKDKTTSGNPVVALQFEYKENRIKTYSEFMEEIKRTGAPVLPVTAAGYNFDYGTVGPTFPMTDEDRSRSLFYEKTLNELTVQANKATSGEKIFMKVVPWTEPGFVGGIYSQGKAIIGIYATIMHGGNMFVEQGPEKKANKITVEGTEVIYNSVNQESVSYHYLNWYNEEQDAYYTLTSYGDKKLNKEQLLSLAGELLESNGN